MEDNHGWENHPVIDTEEAPSEHNFLLLLFFLNICIPIYINKSIDVDFNGG